VPLDDRLRQDLERCLAIDEPGRCLDDLTRRYTFVLPTPELLAVVALYAPIVELGAGTGYWAYQLRQMGVDVVAYDVAPPGGGVENSHHRGASCWTEVLEGRRESLTKHPDRTLFVCWPPQFSMLWTCLDYFKGSTVILVNDGGHLTVTLRDLDRDFDVIETYAATALVTHLTYRPPTEEDRERNKGTLVGMIQEAERLKPHDSRPFSDSAKLTVWRRKQASVG